MKNPTNANIIEEIKELYSQGITPTKDLKTWECFTNWAILISIESDGIVEKIYDCWTPIKIQKTKWPSVDYETLGQIYNALKSQT